MAIQGIEGVLQQMQTTALQAGGSRIDNDMQSDFASELKAALNKISDNQLSARAQAQAFEMGKSDVSLNDVMVDLQKSSVSMQMGIQVRNKLVSAYTDIMNMQI